MSEIVVCNAGFEEGFYQYKGIGELTIPNGWVPWWRRGSPSEVAEGFYKRPEYKPEDRNLGHERVLEGRYAIKWFSTFATHDAGLYQRVAVPHDALLRLTASFQFWSWNPSDSTDGGYAGRVGIDPFGETDPFAASVVWGEWHGVYDPDNWDGRTWRQLLVETPARGAYATIFLNGACLHRVKFNDAYFDCVCLINTKENGEPPTDLKERLQEIYSLLGGVIENL